jgi:hypothetical protein
MVEKGFAFFVGGIGITMRDCKQLIFDILQGMQGLQKNRGTLFEQKNRGTQDSFEQKMNGEDCKK